MLIWQENYKEHIEDTTKQLTQTVQTMTVVENSITEIADKSGLLIETSKELNKTLLETKKMNDSINEGIEVLIDL